MLKNLDMALLRLLGGDAPDAVRESLRTDLRIDAAEARRLVTTAQRKITLAARYHPDRELGRAITRLHECYRLAVAAGDAKAGIAAQRELNRLMGLYRDRAEPAEHTASDGAADRALAQIERHLKPLHLAADDLPIEEHVRLAADLIRRTMDTATPAPTGAENAA